MKIKNASNCETNCSAWEFLTSSFFSCFNGSLFCKGVWVKGFSVVCAWNWPFAAALLHEIVEPEVHRFHWLLYCLCKKLYNRRFSIFENLKLIQQKIFNFFSYNNDKTFTLFLSSSLFVTNFNKSALCLSINIKHVDRKALWLQSYVESSWRQRCSGAGSETVD